MSAWKLRRTLIAMCLVHLMGQRALAMTVIDFEELSPPAGSEYYNGDDLAGGFESHGAWFVNHYEHLGPDCCWEGFAYSRATDTSTPGAVNQYSSFAGGGAGGSQQYAVAFSGYDAGNSGQLASILLPAGVQPRSIEVSNTTFAALAIRDGSPFSFPFGGSSGDEPDWFLLRMEGRDAVGALLAEVTVYLADYRFPDNSLDYVVDEWLQVDLAPLAVPGLARLDLRLDSSDVDPRFGLNTPAYVAIDNLVLEHPVAGDYNDDGLVTLADYTVWRDTLGSAAIPHGSIADGNVNGLVEAGDFATWKANFGSPTLAVAAVIVPAPSASISAIIALSTVCLLYILERGKNP